MSAIDDELIALMVDCQCKMLEVGAKLQEKSCHDWHKHGNEIIGAANILDSWIDGLKTEETEK